VFNATFINILAIYYNTELPAVSNCETLLHNVVSSTLRSKQAASNARSQQ